MNGETLLSTNVDLDANTITISFAYKDSYHTAVITDGDAYHLWQQLGVCLGQKMITAANNLEEQPELLSDAEELTRKKLSELATATVTPLRSS